MNDLDKFLDELRIRFSYRTFTADLADGDKLELIKFEDVIEVLDSYREK